MQNVSEVLVSQSESWVLFRYACSLMLRDPLQDFLALANRLFLDQDNGSYSVHHIEELEKAEAVLRSYGVY